MTERPTTVYPALRCQYVAGRTQCPHNAAPGHHECDMHWPIVQRQALDEWRDRFIELCDLADEMERIEMRARALAESFDDPNAGTRCDDACGGCGRCS